MTHLLFALACAPAALDTSTTGPVAVPTTPAPTPTTTGTDPTTSSRTTPSGPQVLWGSESFDCLALRDPDTLSPGSFRSSSPVPRGAIVSIEHCFGLSDYCTTEPGRTVGGYVEDGCQYSVEEETELTATISWIAVVP